MSCPDYSCSSWDYDAPDFTRERFVRGRKVHRCIECGRAIRKGERHEAATGKWDGGVQTLRTCLRCVAVRSCLTPSGWIYGRLWDAVGEARSEPESVQRACLAEIRAERRRLGEGSR